LGCSSRGNAPDKKQEGTQTAITPCEPQRVGDQKNTAQLCESPRVNKQTNKQRERERERERERVEEETGDQKK